jgi:hypothetical protein
MFRTTTCRRPDATELAELIATYRDMAAKYATDRAAAQKLIAVGETKPDAAAGPAELAAYTVMANLILNLDEVLTKG